MSAMITATNYLVTKIDRYNKYQKKQLIIIIIIIIIIAPLTIVSKDNWGDLEWLYIACHAARTDGGLFTDTG